MREVDGTEGILDGRLSRLSVETDTSGVGMKSVVEGAEDDEGKEISSVVGTCGGEDALLCGRCIRRNVSLKMSDRMGS